MPNVTFPSNLKQITLPIPARNLTALPLTHSEMIAMLADYANTAADPVTVGFAKGLFAYLANRDAITTEIGYKTGHAETVLADQYGAQTVKLDFKV